MTEIFKLLGTIAVDASQAHAEMDDTTQKAKTFSENINKYFNKIVATAATVFSAKALKDFAKSCVDAYAEIAAEESAFSQVMGDYAENAQYKLESVAEKTGVISSRLTPYMTSLTAKFKGLGYDVDEATTLAAEGLTLAADAAAFSNMTLDEAMSHFNSFINGSYEGGEAISLFANDTQMAMWAVEKGLVNTKAAWSELDEKTKQSARMQYAKEVYDKMGITDQSLREAGSYQNQIQNLEELWERFKAVIGEPILENVVLPIVTKLTEFLQWCEDNPEVLEKVFGALSEAVGNITGTMFDGVIDMFTYLVDHEGTLKATLGAIAVAFAGIAVATHPVLSALAAIVGFIMWIAGNNDKAHAEYVANVDPDAGKSFADRNAGKYAHWSENENLKDAAINYLYGADIQDDKWMADAIAAMKAEGLSDDDIKMYREDVSSALAEGDYYVTIEDTWFDEQTEAQLQEQCDNMNLSTTVTANIDPALLDPTTAGASYDDYMHIINSGGTEVPGYNVPKLATGLDRVPRDGYPAILHKDEAVLRASEASVWRNRGGMGDTSRLEVLMQQLIGLFGQVAANTGRGQTVVLDSGALVGQMLPAIDSGLGAFASRKGRRNG